MKNECSTCGGTGQIGFFQGESRFLLTWEECPQCFGTGFVEQDMTGKDDHEEKSGENKNGPGKKKKG